MISNSVFWLMKQSRKESKVVYQELYALEKFGHFVEVIGIANVNVDVNAFVYEEHVAHTDQGQEHVVEHTEVVIFDDEFGKELYGDVNIPASLVNFIPLVVPSSKVLASLIAKLSSKLLLLLVLLIIMVMKNYRLNEGKEIQGHGFSLVHMLSLQLLQHLKPFKLRKM